MLATVQSLGDPERAAGQRRFFKAGPGEYGEGDVFVGVRVPELRKLSTQLRGLPRDTANALLDNAIHEVRQLGLFSAIQTFTRSGAAERADWAEFYRAALRRGRVNNWDLVDLSAYPLLGAWLVEQDTPSELLEWAASADLWERRVGIVGTFAFIKSGAPQPILDVAPIVIDDRRDLIQKAYGWMLREMGKRIDRQLLLDHLEVNAARMGRTALSYATEHLTPEQRTRFRALRP
ncbi:MAG: DNA alkylation repair protein [Gordonia sp. (in: high G+C Gram-positive bacteria)]|uniref:DNA alkylation repair protein n=1 Tax=Gordonia sp. (in: high G+C Gram-positive bacteria) TaxID=84139 RepID=UPI003BB7A199